MFRYEKTEKGVKSLFKKLSKYLHPDLGGDSELFKILLNSKDDALSKIKEERMKRSYERWGCGDVEEEKQEDDGYFKKAVNPVDLMDEMPNKMIEIMVEYSKSHENFDPSFLIKMKEIYEKDGRLSANRFNALLGVFKSFRMEEWYESTCD